MVQLHTSVFENKYISQAFFYQFAVWSELSGYLVYVLSYLNHTSKAYDFIQKVF